jgi:Na+/proline symporter
MWLYKFIQEEGHKRNVRSLSSLVGDKAGSPEAKLAAVLSVLFLSIYAAAQLTSGGKALLVMMGWSELVGILIGFVLVVAYCYAGGIRASIWTDAIQSCVMIVGSMILCWIALGEVGGFSGMNSGLESQDTALTNIMPPDLMFGFSMWVFAFLLGGLAVAGQPQVVSRVMTLGSEKDRKQAMIWFFVWQTPFIILMTFVGLASRVLFPKADSFDPELGLPMLAMDTMPAIGIGMILASIFAATMSTADSQVLACTAAITDDIKPEWREDHKTTKKVTLVVAAFATAISIGGLYVPGGDSVFKLVVLAVYGLGSIFVPLLIIRWMGYKPDSTHSIVMMTSAFTAVMVWSMLPAVMGWKSVTGADGLFPSVPGMGAAFAAHFIMSAMRTPDVSSLGRYNWPDRKKIGTFAAVIMIPLAGLEATYLATAPDSMNSSEPAPDSMWNLTVEFEPHFEEQVINIGDGATDSFQFDIPADAIGVSFMLNYSESNEGGIGSLCDDVESSYDDTNVPSEFRVMWNLQNITGQNCGENPLGGIATWSGFMQTNTYENHQITISELTVEKDAGEIIFDVKVDVNQATPINGDNGEEITLMMRYNTLVSYELTEAE